MSEILEHTILDTIKLIPFLFITYLIMEYIEHKMSNKTKKIVEKSGKFGPAIGAILGIIPQCGFSAAASNLYAVRIISLGTLMAIFLSTSDEMIPVLISESIPIEIIIKILLIKLVIGMLAGFIIDLILRIRNNKKEQEKINDICEHEHCHCEEGILKSSIIHTVHITVFILIITFIVNIIIHYVGEENISNIIMNVPVLGSIIAGIIGLIPNCASSVILTELYVQNLISVSIMISGLLVGSGVGILVLFKQNRNIKQNIKIIILLYSIGVISGILLELIGIKF